MDYFNAIFLKTKLTNHYVTFTDSPTQEQPTSQVNGMSSYQVQSSEPEPQSFDQNQSNEQQYDQQDQYNDQQGQYNNQYDQSYDQSNNVQDAGEAKGLRARALWDYQAGKNLFFTSFCKIPQIHV